MLLVSKTEKFLFSDKVKPDYETVYNAICKYADDNVGGVVIYHNADTAFGADGLNQFLAVLKYIATASDIHIKVVGQIVHKNGNPPTLHEYNLGF